MPSKTPFEKYPIYIVLPMLSTRDLLRLHRLYDKKNLSREQIEERRALVTALLSRHESKISITHQMLYLEHGDMPLFADVVSRELSDQHLKSILMSSFSTLEHKLKLVSVKYPGEEMVATGEHVRRLGLSITTAVSDIALSIRFELILLQLRSAITQSRLKALKDIILKLQPSDIERLLSVILSGFNGACWQNYDCAIQIMSITTHLCSQPNHATINVFIQPLLARISDDRRGIRHYILYTIKALIPGLRSQDAQLFIFPLLNVIKDDPCPSARKAALEAMAVLCSKVRHQGLAICVDPLYQLFISEDNKDVSAQVIKTMNSLFQALKRINRYISAGPLLSMLNDSDPHIRRLALRELQTLLPILEIRNTGTLTDHLLSKLASEDVSVREDSLKTIHILLPRLTKLDKKKCVSPLLMFIEPTHNKICYQVLQMVVTLMPMLEYLDKCAFLAPILEVFRSSRFDALSRCESFKAIKLMITLLNDSDINGCVISLITILNDSHAKKGLRNQALQTLPIFLSRLTPFALESVTCSLASRLLNSHLEVHPGMLNLVSQYLPMFEIEKFLNSLLITLLETSLTKRINALKILLALVPKIEKNALDALTLQLLFFCHNPDVHSTYPIADFLAHVIILNKTSVRFKHSLQALPSLYSAIKYLKQLLGLWEKTRKISEDSFLEIVQSYRSRSRLTWFSSHKSQAMQALDRLNSQDNISHQHIEQALSQDPHKIRRLRLFREYNDNVGSGGTDEVILALKRAFEERSF